MDIDFLKDLTELEGNRSISLSEIETLEQIYNSGMPFPKALKELLYLAGGNCAVLDYSLTVNQQEIQTDARECLSECDQKIDLPFYVIELHNGGDSFLFVYLNQGDDPFVYEATTYEKDASKVIGKGLSRRLSEFISLRIDMVKQGRNPF